MGLHLIQVLAWLCLVAFAAGICVVWRRYARLPLHIRWDIHPLPKESVREKADGRDPGKLSVIAAEIRFALREGLLFEQCFKFNRDMWYATYPFHIGVFASVLWALLLLATAFFGLTEWYVSRILIIGSGGVGLVLGSAGGFALLAKRLLNADLRTYTAPREYANLILLLVIFLLGLITWIFEDPDFSISGQYARSLLTLSPLPAASWLFWLTAVVFSVFVAALPFTSMKHGIAKFFTYHQVRWDDQPNVRGSELERRIATLMTNPITWSAPHIGKMKWQDVPNRADEVDR
jgi:nitrate reductase gamma subunit